MASEVAEGWFDPEETTFGDRLTGAREHAGMTQAQLAERLGVKQETLDGWENDYSEPRANKLSMLAGVLNLSLRWLLNGEGDGPRAPDRTFDVPRDLAEVMAEVREMRVGMLKSADRLGRLERRLTAALGDTAIE